MRCGVRCEVRCEVRCDYLLKDAAIWECPPGILMTGDWLVSIIERVLYSSVLLRILVYFSVLKYIEVYCSEVGVVKWGRVSCLSSYMVPTLQGRGVEKKCEK